jgi:hypothetical protein
LQKIDAIATVGTFRQGYLLVGCPGPWHLTIRNLPLAFWVTWQYGPGQAAGTTVSGPSAGLHEVRSLRAPWRAGRLSGCPRGPGLSRGSGAAACDGRTITGLTAPTGHGGPDLPPSGEGSGAATCLRLEALCVSPAHLPAFNAVAGSGAPKSKRAACH